MKKLHLLLVCLLVSALSMAQTSAECNTAIEKIASANAKYNTIQCKFTQTKHFAMMENTIKSEGNFSFTRPDKLTMEYTKPQGNLLSINDQTLVLVNGKKKNTFNTKNDNKMRNLRNTLLLSVGGDINGIAAENNASIDFKQTKEYYIFTLTKGKGAKSTISKLELSYSKKDFSLCLMKMEESNGNYTIYSTPVKTFNK